MRVGNQKFPVLRDLFGPQLQLHGADPQHPDGGADLKKPTRGYRVLLESGAFVSVGAP
jgi:hypothetical protein